MKNAFLFITMILYCYITPAQLWTWATSIGSAGNEFSEEIAIDAADNIYALVDFNSTSITINNTTLTNTQAPYRDILLVKYDSQGNFLWAKSFGGTGQDFSTGIDVDISGNILITGGFDSPYFYIGSDSIAGLGMWDFYDTFVIKLDSSGNLIWAKCDQIFSDDVGMDITSDAAGNVYVTGNSGAFISINKYDSLGDSLWTVTQGGSYADAGFSIKVDSIGNVYVAGGFTSPTISFGSTTYYNMSPVPSVFEHDVFLIKLNSSGNILWSQVAGSIGDDRGILTLDASGNIFLAGSFSGPSIVFGSDTLLNTGDLDIFISKYNNSGSLLWVKSIGSSGSETVADIEADASGLIYLLGSFSSSLTIGTSTITSMGSINSFIAQYNTMGTDISAISAGGIYNYGVGMEFTSGGAFIIGGVFSSSSLTFGSNTLLSAGGQDVFVVMLDQVVDIYELSNSTIKIYPNPTTDNVYIKINNAKPGEIHLKVCDIHGRQVYEGKYNTNENISITTAGWLPGIYVVEMLDTKGDNYVVKVVKL